MGNAYNSYFNCLMETLYEEEGNGFIRLRFDETLGRYMMHLDCKTWSKSELIRYRKIFKIVCAKLRARGITEVYGLAEDTKAIKFNKLFGATTTGELALDANGFYQAIIIMET